MTQKDAGIPLKIDGMPRTARPGTTILDAACAAGISIPTLCHMRGLPPLATCRICMVEETTRSVLLPACATPVGRGMDIRTDTERVIGARRTVMELILASHPLTCLVCDSHGRCELRRVAAHLGVGHIPLDRIPAPVPHEASVGPVRREPAKCILCGRCVAVCQSVVARGAVDYHGRGFRTTVATAHERPLGESSCDACGVCVAVCPTGALDLRERRYRRQAPDVGRTLCHVCGCGCTMALSLVDGEIVERMPAAPEGRVPLGCARGVLEDDVPARSGRLTVPIVRESGTREEVGWDEAVEISARRIEAILSRHGRDSLAVWCSPLASCEEGFLLQRFSRDVLGTSFIDVAGSGVLRGIRGVLDGSSRAGEIALCGIEELESSDTIVVVGSGVTRQAPAVAYAIRRAAVFREARLILIDEGDENPLADRARVRLVSKGEGLPLSMACLAETLFTMVSKFHMDPRVPADTIQAPVQGDELSLMGIRTEDLLAAAGEILSARRLCIVLGFSADRSKPCADVEDASFIAHASWHPGRQRVAILPAGAFTNEIGLLRAGVGCVRPGENGDSRNPSGIASTIEMMREGRIRGIILFGIDPVGFVNRRLGRDPGALDVIPASSLDLILVVDSRLRSVTDLATCQLPLCEHEEREGTFIGVDAVQRVSRAVRPPAGQSLDGIEIIARLARRLGHPSRWAREDALDELRGGSLMP